MSRARDIANFGDGVGAADLDSTLDLSGKTVTLPSGTGGKVLQVVQATTASAGSASASNWQTIVGVNITPSSTSSKVLLMAYSILDNVTGSNETGLRFRRDGTALPIYGIYNSWHYSTGRYQDGLHISYVDGPSSTSVIDYNIQLYGASGQRDYYGGYIIAMEIAG